MPQASELKKTLILKEIDNLPDHYHDTFSDGFIFLLAVMRLYGFSVLRADESLPAIEDNQDFWAELGHPSIWIHAPAAPQDELRAANPGTPEHTDYTNQVLLANLSEQRRLLALMDEFYEIHESPSFYARLIAETIDLGETCLRPQGAGVRVISKDEQLQRQLRKEFQAEMRAFAEFLANKL